MHVKHPERRCAPAIQPCESLHKTLGPEALGSLNPETLWTMEDLGDLAAANQVQAPQTGTACGWNLRVEVPRLLTIVDGASSLIVSRLVVPAAQGGIACQLDRVQYLIHLDLHFEPRP